MPARVLFFYGQVAQVYAACGVKQLFNREDMESLSLVGTWDSGSRQMIATVDAVWDEENSLTMTFDVVVP